MPTPGSARAGRRRSGPAARRGGGSQAQTRRTGRPRWQATQDRGRPDRRSASLPLLSPLVGCGPVGWRVGCRWLLNEDRPRTSDRPALRVTSSPKFLTSGFVDLVATSLCFPEGVPPVVGHNGSIPQHRLPARLVAGDQPAVRRSMEGSRCGVVGGSGRVGADGSPGRLSADKLMSATNATAPTASSTRLAGAGIQRRLSAM
jgi:hypothetical protein